MRRQTAEENLKFYVIQEPSTENTISWPVTPCSFEKAFSELHSIATQKIIPFKCHCENIKFNIRLFPGK
jgi:hypothetical protein